MNSLSVLIVDDESSARDLLKNLLVNIPWITIVGEADNVDLAMREVLKSRPDVILLDVQMPRKDGFVLIRQMMNHQTECEVIFVTAFEKYAIKAIKASAFDYLLKPVNRSELLASLEKLSEKVNAGKTKEQFSSLIHHLSDTRKIKFRNRTGFVMINPDEILYCLADSNYTRLELDSGKSLILSINLGRVEEMLPKHYFTRISRSAVVNLKYISLVDRKNMTLEISNSGSVSLSISKKYFHKLETECDRLLGI